MATVKIDEVEYETESLSDEALAQVQSIQFVDAEISRLQSRISVMTTARNAYASALHELLPEPPDQGAATDTDLL